MFGEIDHSRAGDDLFQEITVENVTDYRDVRFQLALEVAVCDVDVPEGVPAGTIYLKGTFRQLRQALAKDVPELLGALEVGVSEARRTALSLAGNGGAFHRAELAKSRMVPGSRKRR